MLRDKLPREGKDLVAGVREVKLAWDRLSKRYGDRRIAILTIQKRLYGLNLGGGRSYANVPAVPLTSSGFTIALWIRFGQQAMGYPEIFSDVTAPRSIQLWFICLIII